MFYVEQDVIKEFFGDNYTKVAAFEQLLEEEGNLRGLIGPREVDKLWERHILNSAAVGQLIVLRGTTSPAARDGEFGARNVLRGTNADNSSTNKPSPREQNVPRGTNAATAEPTEATQPDTPGETTQPAEPIVPRGTFSGSLVDVGSGAGLPGVVLACMFPEAQVYLVESMLRRTDWLSYAAEKCAIDNITVVRGRAEELQKSGLIPPCDYATARAVAPLNKLLPWTMPFLKPGGQLLALKGSSAPEEVAEAQKELKKYSNKPAEVLTLRTVEGAEETTAVRVVRK
jgi:16S rRNA (guanine527-N7)-methyltransferase